MIPNPHFTNRWGWYHHTKLHLSPDELSWSPLRLPKRGLNFTKKCMGGMIFTGFTVREIDLTNAYGIIYMIFNGSISLKPNLELAEGMKDWLVWLRILPTVIILSFGLTMSSSEKLCKSENLGPQKLCNNYNRLKVSLATSVVFLYDFVHEVDYFSIETHALGFPHVRNLQEQLWQGPACHLPRTALALTSALGTCNNTTLQQRGHTADCHDFLLRTMI